MERLESPPNHKRDCDKTDLNDTTCRIVTVLEKWNRLIKTNLSTERGKPPYKDRTLTGLSQGASKKEEKNSANGRIRKPIAGIAIWRLGVEYAQHLMG